jgi:ABC-type transport system involved in multi-copper enzyme maturation permease subunit
MTTTIQPPAPGPAGPSGGAGAIGAASGGPQVRGKAPLRLVKAEMLKLWTTNSWWIFGIFVFTTVGLALLFNTTQAHFEIKQALNPPDFREGLPPGQGPSDAEIEQMRADWLAQFDLNEVLERSAANVFTSGQFFGLLIAMLIGTLLVTNEFYHQTATTTFLTTPKRTRVIMAKLAGGIGIAAILWLVSTAINLGVGTLFFGAEGQPNGLTEWPVQRAIIMDLPAYAIWAVFGIGLGVLIRNQLGATITGAALYLIGTFLAQAVFYLIYEFIIKETWVLQSMVLVPGVASSVMISPQPIQLGFSEPEGVIYGPQWWVGALILVGYGIVAGLIGTLITRKRDIS